MQHLSVVLALALVSYPLLIAPSTAIMVIGSVALALCCLGILFSTPVLVAGVVLALGEYALALWLWAGPLRLTGAVLLGVGLVVLLETGDNARRARHAARGPGVVTSQLRYWAVLGALSGMGALVLTSVARAASGSVRLPWVPAIAAAGAGVALIAIAIGLAGGRSLARD